VTVGKARLVVPPRSGDAKVADEATVVEDAAIEKADAKVVEEDNVLVAMAGLLELFGKSDSLSLSILFKVKNFLKKRVYLLHHVS